MSGIIIKPRRTYTPDANIDLQEGEIVQDLVNRKIITIDKDGNIVEYPSIDLLKKMISDKSLITPEDLADYFDQNNVTYDEETGKLIITVSGTEEVPTSDYEFKLSSNYDSKLVNYSNNSYNIQYDGCSHCIKDGGDDIYNWGNYIYCDGAYLDYDLAKFKSYGFLLYELKNIDYIKFWGNIDADTSILSDDSAYINNTTNLQVVDGVEIYASYKIVHTAVTHAIHHILFTDRLIDSHFISSNARNDYDEYRFSNSGNAYLLVYWSNCSEAWDNGKLTLETIFDILFKQN